MGIFSKAWKNEIKNETYSLEDERFLEFLGIDSDLPADKKSEATYFRCLKILSESLAKLPLKIYKETNNGNKKVSHYLNYLLRTQPNNNMNASIFWNNVEYNRNRFGNSFVLIDRHKLGRNSGKVKNLWIIPNESVDIIIDDKAILGFQNEMYYRYTDSSTHKKYIFMMDEVLHFKNWITYKGEGKVGLAVQDILKNYIDRGIYANDFITKMTKNGMMTDKVIVQYTGKMDGDGEKALIQHMENFSQNGSSKYITIPSGLSVQNLSSKLTDSQFIELTKYNSILIGQAFGISPQMLGDWEKGNFANAGIQNEMFYKDTLLPILGNYEQELAIKLFTKSEKEKGYYFNFNVDSILRSSFKERIDTYSVAIQNGILTSNECRELENKEGKDGGNELVVNGNIMKLKDASIQYTKQYTEGGETKGE